MAATAWSSPNRALWATLLLRRSIPSAARAFFARARSLGASNATTAFKSPSVAKATFCTAGLLLAEQQTVNTGKQTPPLTLGKQNKTTGQPFILGSGGGKHMKDGNVETRRRPVTRRHLAPQHIPQRYQPAVRRKLLPGINLSGLLINR